MSAAQVPIPVSKTQRLVANSFIDLYKAVIIASGTEVQLAVDDTVMVLGVTITPGNIGFQVDIITLGIVPMEAGVGGFNDGEIVTADANGNAITSSVSAQSFIIGQALTSAAAGQIGLILVRPQCITTPVTPPPPPPTLTTPFMEYAFSSGTTFSVAAPNAIALFPIHLSVERTFTHIAISGSAVDANNYGVGLYDTLGNRIAHTAAFALAGGSLDKVIAEGTATAPIGDYLWAFTGDNVGGAIFTDRDTGGSGLLAYSTASVSAVGVLPATIVPTFAISQNFTRRPVMVLH